MGPFFLGSYRVAWLVYGQYTRGLRPQADVREAFRALRMGMLLPFAIRGR